MQNVGLKKSNCYLSHSPEETKEIGAKLAESFLPGQIIRLTGDLGAGKTTLMKGIIPKLIHTISEHEVTSPTFTLMNLYEGSVTVCHFDLYRIDDVAFADMGLDEYFTSDHVCFIEWPEKIAKVLPTNVATIKIEAESEHTRKIIFETS